MGLWTGSCSPLTRWRTAYAALCGCVASCRPGTAFEDFGNEAAELAQQLRPGRGGPAHHHSTSHIGTEQCRQRQGVALGPNKSPQGRIADSIEAGPSGKTCEPRAVSHKALTALLREDVLDCQRLQAAASELCVRVQHLSVSGGSSGGLHLRGTGAYRDARCGGLWIPSH